MANLINLPQGETTLGTNYRKSFAPFTRFGTRQMRFYRIFVNGIDLLDPTNGGDGVMANPYESQNGGPDGWGGGAGQPNFASDSAFAQCLQGIQTQAEIYGVWHPDSDFDGAPYSWFMVMVAGDTHPDRERTEGYDFNPNAEWMGDAVWKALGANDYYSVYVREWYIWGDLLDEDTGNSVAKDAHKAAIKAQRASDISKMGIKNK